MLSLGENEWQQWVNIRELVAELVVYCYTGCRWKNGRGVQVAPVSENPSAEARSLE